MKYKANDTRLALILIILTLASWSLFACGRSDTAPTDTVRLAATPLPTLALKQPTTMIQAAGEAKASVSPTEEVDLARGERIYTSQKCADCHGAQGEGVAGKAKALAGTSLNEEAFIDILRTGGKGELGNDHLYGPQAISPSGVKALYAYIKSLSTP
jgi:mono/diheme cytochrome c family protein